MKWDVSRAPAAARGGKPRCESLTAGSTGVYLIDAAAGLTRTNAARDRRKRHVSTKSLKLAKVGRLCGGSRTDRRGRERLKVVMLASDRRAHFTVDFDGGNRAVAEL